MKCKLVGALYKHTEYEGKSYFSILLQTLSPFIKGLDQDFVGDGSVSYKMSYNSKVELDDAWDKLKKQLETLKCSGSSPVDGELDQAVRPDGKGGSRIITLGFNPVVGK